ncbi:MAG: hypothetical protein NTZ21_20590 [Actinobacteria bacterium]|nr:hypothetical protein [Actinomycetota bacterium]
MRVGLGVAVACAVVLLSACSDDGDSAPETTFSLGPTECAVVDDPVLMVDEIDAAVAAVEAELGGEQVYFEINATPLLVNLFVADPVAKTVTPYVYVGGELSAEEALPVESGSAFPASALAFDPQRVLSCITDQLPDSGLDVFFVEANADGAVRYTVLTTNAQGGQLTIEVTGAGLVLAVDAI